MRALKVIAMCLLLTAAAVICRTSQAASTSELLQQGLYAEEVEGNIDSAIKAYGKVIQNNSAPRNLVAQALLRQGLCYIKIGDEQAARTALQKLVTEYADQAEITEKARAALDDLTYFDPAALMPAGTLVYVELGSPGKQVETILNMLKGTPFENPLAAVYNASKAGGQNAQKTPGDIIGALLNPSMMAEFKKIRSSAIGVTGITQNNPPMVIVLYPGKSDALRGLILMALGMAGQPGEAIEDMNTFTIQPDIKAAYDDKVVIIAKPAQQLEWSVKQYKGLISEPTLASSNPSFAKLNKKQRQSNMLTFWANVDEVYTEVLKQFPQGQVPPQITMANAFADFAHIDCLTISSSIEPDGFIDRREIIFKEGHQCLLYDLIRTPNISKDALQAVPADAVALASFALSANENQAETIRAKVKNVTGLDIGREIFANIEQVVVFAVSPKQANPFFPGYFGLVITSHNPQQTREIIGTLLQTMDVVASAGAVEQTPGRYRIGQIQNNPLYCYVEQAGNATILSLSPEVAKASAAAVKDGNNVCKAGPLSACVNKLPPTASKLILVNAGGAIRLASPVVTAGIEEGQRIALQNNIDQLALAADKTIFEVSTDEQLNSFAVNSKISGLPPLNQVFGPVTQIAGIIQKSKTEKKAEDLRSAAPVTILPAAKPPVIDGVAEDLWNAAESIKMTNFLYSPISSPNDLAANFKTMWDKDNLYLLVDVTDDILKNDASEAWENDAVEVFIDATNGKAASYGPTDYQYVFVWDKTSPKIQEVKHSRTDGVQYAFATTDMGYRAEIKFPWSTLGTKAHAGGKIGLDVHICDNDTGGKRETKLIWHDTKDKAWENPQAFGNAELAGLIGWWKFDETEGKVAFDSSGNGNNSTPMVNPSWRPQGGKIGGAIELNGKSDYIMIENESAFDITGQITISAWVNINTVPQEWTAIVTKGDSAWRLSTVFANNIFHFGVAKNENDYLNGKTAVDSGQWHNVVCVYDGQKMSIYVDGKLDASKPRTGPIATNDFPVCIGENIEIKNRFFHGLIDDVRVYNYALSANEISALAEAK